jgi:hypothetical protein
MAVTPDQLLIATRDLFPEIEKMWLNAHPLTEALFDKMKREKTSGPYAAFNVEIDGPGSAQMITSGNEIINGTRRNILRQGRLDVPTIIYSYSVNAQQLRRATGENAIVSLLKLYPEAAMAHFRNGLGIHFMLGRHADSTEGGSGIGDVSGMFHLNGDQNWQTSPATAANTGLLQFRTPAAQNDTFMGLPRQGAANGTPKWYNHYEVVTSFITHGRERLRRLYNNCEMRSGSYGGPDLMFCDPISHENYYNSLTDQVRYMDTVKGEKSKGRKAGLAFMDGVVYSEVAMSDDSAAFGHGADGTWYMLNSKTFACYTLPDVNEAGVESGDSYFGLRGPTRQENRDSYLFEILFSAQPFCKFLAANGCAEGTAL